MALPKIQQSTKEVVVPSTNKKVKIRSLTVKEEKSLVEAQQTGKQTDVVKAIKDIIAACVSSRGFNVEELATFDIEYIFLAIRAKSIGKSVELDVLCPDDKETRVTHKVDLEDVKVVFDKEHSKIFKLDADHSIQMKYPTMDMVMSADVEEVSVEKSMELVVGCISQIFTEEESWAASDSSKEELMAWVEELQPHQFELVEKFFATMPKLAHTIEVTNPKTKVKSEILLEGLGSFFA